MLRKISKKKRKKRKERCEINIGADADSFPFLFSSLPVRGEGCECGGCNGCWEAFCLVRHGLHVETAASSGWAALCLFFVMYVSFCLYLSSGVFIVPFIIHFNEIQWIPIPVALLSMGTQSKGDTRVMKQTEKATSKTDVA